MLICILTKNVITSCSVTMPLFRSEERFSRNAETDLVCRLLLEKKKRARGHGGRRHQRVVLDRLDSAARALSQLAEGGARPAEPAQPVEARRDPTRRARW